MNTSPLPQPHEFTCEKCGFGWSGKADFCPQCGAAQTGAARRDASPTTMLAYGCGAMFLGTFGVCFVPAVFHPLDAPPLAVFGAFWLVLLLFCLWKFFRGGN